jgi:hypothetical protein
LGDGHSLFSHAGTAAVFGPRFHFFQEHQEQRMEQHGVVSIGLQSPVSIATEQHYTVKQVAEMWGLSEECTRRLFRDEPGVLRISLPALSKARKQRPHVSLRIPASVLVRFHQERSAGFVLEVKPGRRRV